MLPWWWDPVLPSRCLWAKGIRSTWNWYKEQTYSHLKASSLTFKVPESCTIKKHLTLIKSKFIRPNGNCKRNIFLSIYPPIHPSTYLLSILIFSKWEPYFKHWKLFLAQEVCSKLELKGGCFVQSLSRVWLFDSMDYSMPDFPVFHYFPEFAQIRVHWVGDAL